MATVGHIHKLALRIVAKADFAQEYRITSWNFIGANYEVKRILQVIFVISESPQCKSGIPLVADKKGASQVVIDSDIFNDLRNTLRQDWQDFILVVELDIGARLRWIDLERIIERASLML